MAQHGPMGAGRVDPCTFATQHIVPPGRVRRVDGNASLYGKRFKYDCYQSCLRAVPCIRARRGRRFRTVATAAHNTMWPDNSTHTTVASQGSKNTNVDHTPTHVCPDCCFCCLDVHAVFKQTHDIPRPVVPLYPCELHELLRRLPLQCQNYPWKRRFDTARDGFSLATLYRLLAPAVVAGEPTVGILFVAAVTPNRQEDAGQPIEMHTAVDGCPSVTGIIGCYAPQPPSLELPRRSRFFSGSSETFVFRVHMAHPRGIGALSKQQRHVGHEDGNERVSVRHMTTANGNGAVKNTEEEHVGYIGERSSSSSSDDECVATYEETAPEAMCGGEPHAAVSSYPYHHTIHKGTEEGGLCCEYIDNKQHVYDHEHNEPWEEQHREMPLDSTSSVEDEAHTRTELPSLVESYAWSGDVREHEFMYCSSEKLCFGARAASEAAIMIDASLQRGSCALWCRTFSCSSLLECGASVDRRAWSSERAFVVRRLVWFSVDSSDDTFRDVAPAEKARWCGCERCDAAARRSAGRCATKRHVCSLDMT